MLMDHMKSIIEAPVRFYIYADDVKFMMVTRTKEDRDKLQRALLDFESWSRNVGLRLSANKCFVMHLGRGNERFHYTLEGSQLEVAPVMRDLGVLISDRLSYGEHVDSVVRRSSMVVSWILRAFVLSSPTAYLKLFESHVVPIFLYASAVWNPSRRGDIEKLRRVQARFLRRVEFRCKLERGSLVTVDVVDRLGKADMRVLRSVIRREDFFNELFSLQATGSRRGFILRPLSNSRTKKMDQQFAWRMSSLVNGN